MLMRQKQPITCLENDPTLAKKPLSKTDFDEIQNVLLRKREEENELLASLREGVEDIADHRGRYSDHMAEQGSDAMAFEQKILAISRSEDYIENIDQALKSIELGEFGICTVCGRNITKDRMKAAPFSNKHTFCKMNGKTDDNGNGIH